MCLKIVYILLASILLCVSSFCQTEFTTTSDSAKQIIYNQPPATSFDDIQESPELLKPDLQSTNGWFELRLSIAILIFGILVVIAEVYLAHTNHISSEYVFKMIIVTLIIIASLMLITAGYSNNQITGVTGILGSIAGYLLGKTDSSTKTKSNEEINR